SLKKSIMGGMVSGIMSASNFTFFGFFYRFFTPFLMRSPWVLLGFYLIMNYVLLYTNYYIKAIG
ncbi:MAG: hypothetical protein LBK43_07865, partial [Treponema sp.]|nr:hypothetical protein [Treponema sp.]